MYFRGNSVRPRKIYRKPLHIPEKICIFFQILRKKICTLSNAKDKKSVYTDKISMSGGTVWNY